MTRSLIDTDTLSYVLKVKDLNVADTVRQYLRVFRRLTVSAITLAEIVEGLETLGDPVRIEAFLEGAQGYEILSIGRDEGILAGRILGALARTGQKIGDLDPFIAAVAISNGLPLVTNNERHYQRIVDLGFPLELANWRKP